MPRFGSSSPAPQLEKKHLQHPPLTCLQAMRPNSCSGRMPVDYSGTALAPQATTVGSLGVTLQSSQDSRSLCRGVRGRRSSTQRLDRSSSQALQARQLSDLSSACGRFLPLTDLVGTGNTSASYLLVQQPIRRSPCCLRLRRHRLPANWGSSSTARTRQVSYLTLTTYHLRALVSLPDCSPKQERHPWCLCLQYRYCIL